MSLIKHTRGAWPPSLYTRVAIHPIPVCRVWRSELLVTSHSLQADTDSRPASPLAINGLGTEDSPVRFSEVEDKLSTGDLAVLYRGENRTPHYAVFIKDRQTDSNLPLLLLKGKTKPLPLEKFDRKVPRDAHTVSATTRIFYGDYRKVAVHTLLTSDEFNIKEISSIIDGLSNILFTDEEVEAIRNAPTPQERSAILCTFMVAYFYKGIGVLEAQPNTISPATLVDSLQFSAPTYIKLPKVREGPMASGDPPLLAKLVWVLL